MPNWLTSNDVSFPDYPFEDVQDLVHDVPLEELRDSSVLVTGATGFIGSHLTHALGSLGVRPSLFVLDYERQVFPSGSSIYHGNLADLHDCLRIVGRANPEIIFHLAAQPLVDTALNSVVDTMESNVRGAYNLLEACRSAGKRIRAIVWVSTDKVYGLQHEPLREESPLLGYDHPYDASKLCGDLLAQTYANAFSFPLVIVRSGNVYGGGDLHWDRLVPGTIRSTLREEPTVIRSDGSLKRDYIYVSDIVRGYLLALDGLLTGKLPGGSVINFGAERSYTVLETVEEILASLGRQDLDPIIKNIARNEIAEQHVSYERAKELLGWEPLIDLSQGIQKTADWYKHYLKAETDSPVRKAA
ncbi:MAG: NAD-dependent epimerase/dehydratase family protein [Anaerolineae bacterium]|nr:NAD-dependent epimerase/dehydratase family protein [Anaerolineae bacterium]MBT4456927.1 NAD-dependent epimerase/dehydratase family protein [Anaerolineae bacterium]MBT4843685.1 NAD-dependent epimerase/dehydratase family protein [Anaerolineae bacterium]MBT6060323.1 NAD-dependent epimerase/dehydratase family protein [Anaerolineae bacterium]MBT6323802.1 NAD-dependent epimerase/dehydratase family protein [Anaerolineae bacterium]